LDALNTGSPFTAKREARSNRPSFEAFEILITATHKASLPPYWTEAGKPLISSQLIETVRLWRIP
jgi:hypothetical protein